LIELWADPTVKVGVTFAVITAVMIGVLAYGYNPDPFHRAKYRTGWTCDLLGPARVCLRDMPPKVQKKK
jgi:hypothetical protein